MASTETTRGDRTWYVVGVGFLATFIIMFAGFMYLKNVQDQADASKRAADRLQTQQAQLAEAQRKQALADTCSVIDRMEEFYRGVGSPPTLAVADAWAKLRVTVGCAPKGGN